MRSEPYNGDLRELVGEDTLRGDQPVYTYCPVHEDNNRPSLAVYDNHAHCYTCGAHLSRKQFSDAYSAEAKWQAKLRRQLGGVRRVTTPTVKVDVAALIRSSQAILKGASQKRQYLYDRGLSDETIDTYALGYSGSAYTLPLLDEPQTVRFRRDDAVTTDGNKYWGLRGQNDTRLYPHNIRGTNPIVLTEGEFDALLLRQYGLNAYSFTNGSKAIPPQSVLDAFFGDRAVVLMRDQDSPGQESSEDLLMLLKNAYPIYWLLERGKDVTEVWQHDRDFFDYLTQLVTSGTYLETGYP